MEGCLGSDGGRVQIKKGLKTGLDGGSLLLWRCEGLPALSYSMCVPLGLRVSLGQDPVSGRRGMMP